MGIEELFPLSEIDIEFESNNKRRAYRVKCKDFFVEYENKRFKVNDISATGISFWIDEKTSFKEGTEFNLNLLLKEKPILEDLRAKVVRREKDLVGCEFVDLNRKQVLALDKLVLELQKKEIEKLKKKS